LELRRPKIKGAHETLDGSSSLQAFDLIATAYSATLRRVEGGNPEFQNMFLSRVERRVPRAETVVL
jgi:hypothetical protein